MTPGELWRRLRFLLQRRQHMNDLDEEMRLHRELRTRASQLSEHNGRRQFGNETQWKEAVWDVWSVRWLESIWRDLVFGTRVLRAAPGFTAVAVLTLALGIGATTAMFSVIDNVLLRPFPYAHQERLYTPVIHDLSRNEAGDRSMLPMDELLDYRERSHSFEEVMGVGISRALWDRGSTPESINAPLVTANAFNVLGVPAQLGRTAVAADAAPGAAPICIMSYAFWQRRFGGEASALGTRLLLDGEARTVVGIMPARFIFWSADVWIPVEPRRTGGLQPPWFYMLGRLRPGVQAEDARRELQGIGTDLAKKYRPNLYTDHFTVRLDSFVHASTKAVSRTLYTLLAAVALLLAIACVNVANLLLARWTTRKRELALRASLGAGWRRLVRQLFVESLLLATMGATLGCALAFPGLRLLLALLPPDTFPDEAVLALNTRVLFGAAAVTVVTSIFFGLLPVVGSWRKDIADALKSGGRQHSGFRGMRSRQVLIACEVAIATVLLAAAALTMLSFMRERAVELGIVPENLVTAEVFLSKGHRTAEQQASFRRDLSASLARLPGVVNIATTTDFTPFSGARTRLTSSAGIDEGQAENRFALVDPALFDVLHVPFVSGHNIARADLSSKHMVAIINETLAKRYFPNQNSVGQRLQVHTLAFLPERSPQNWVEIAGVVRDFKNDGVLQPAAPEAFLPYTISALGGFSVLLRTAGNPGPIVQAIDSTALQLDGTAVVRHVRTMTDALDADVYAKPRFGLQIFSVFTSMGLVLVSAGLFSVTAYVISQRRRELGSALL